jgi:hypothetical protein
MPEQEENEIIVDAETAVRLAREVLASDRPTAEAIAIAEYLLDMLPVSAALAEEDEG